MPQTKRIEVFRAGTFQPMQGDPITFSADDLRAIASNYDAAAPAPVVVGHPKTDDPAYGWAAGFSVDGDRLVADIGEIEPSFADAVKDGRYKKISLSLFTPDATNNPKPGHWYPKHIGFLGAAAPAVPGLRTVAFASDEGAVTFEFADAGALRDVAGLFRSMRDFFIEKFGLEAADKALPAWSIGWIDDAADRDPPQPYPAYSEPPMPDPKPGLQPDDLARRQSDLDKRERDLNHADHVAFAEGLIGEGRLIPVLKDKVVAVLDGLAPIGGVRTEVSFAEGGESKTVAVADLIKDVLKAQPKVVSFGQVDLGAPPDGSVDFAMPQGMTADPASAELHARALAYQAQHPGSDYMAAVAAVNR